MKRILKVFAALRKEGFIAKWNFMCCRSCGGAEIAHETTKLIDAGKTPPVGAIYNCKQDVEGAYLRSGLSPRAMRLHAHDELFPNAKIHIGFGLINTHKHGVIGRKDPRWAGRRLVKHLKAAGIAFEWNGKGDTRIAVSAEDALQEVSS